MSREREGSGVEAQVAAWRGHLRRSGVLREPDLDELEDHLREQMTALRRTGLDDEEALLVALRRLGATDALTAEFARVYADRLWRQLVPVTATPVPEGERRRMALAWGLAFTAAALVKLPELFGLHPATHEDFYLRNASFLVLPALLGYFAATRRLPGRVLAALGTLIAALALIVNLYPFRPGGDTLRLAALHLPLALWLGVVGVAYAGGRWRDPQRRMDFVRFSGEFVVYFALLGLGGGVLVGATAAIYASVGLDAEPFIERWLLPCGVAGAIVIAAWLVEAKQSVVENMAPVLARLFAPLFAAVLLGFLGTVLLSGRGIRVERDVLIAFDLVLAIVLGLVLYALSARDSAAPPGLFDRLLVLLIVSALVVDALALAAMTRRILLFGWTPNRAMALGFNLVLLGNLAPTGVLYAAVLRGRRPVAALERWQTGYLPVFGAWAAAVVVLFPLLFHFA